MKKILLTLCILVSAIHHSQVYYSQDFNTPGLNGWTSNDLDGDTYQWFNANASGIYSAFGTGSIISQSYRNNVPLTPDNLITSPLIDLSTVTSDNVFLAYDQFTDVDYPSEKYSVYVTTSNTPATIIASTPVHTETVTTGGYHRRYIDLTSFIGQQVYVSFRHYDCTDQYYLILDNIQLKSVEHEKDITLKQISLERYGVINTDYLIKNTVINNGSVPVNNITINWNDGTADHSSTIPLATPLSTGEEITITHPIAVNYTSVVQKNIAVSITQVNGAADSTPADNSKSTNFNTVSQNSPKKVLIEEGTGTWCGWCPRGAVAMAAMDANYPENFIGIAVHNQDPMMLDEYNAGANFSGFPGMNIDRVILGENVTSQQMEDYINARKNLVVPAELNASSTLSGNSLTFNASATFRSNYSNANFRFAVVMVEDDVKGTSDGYAQHNYFTGGGSGPMGGFENLPNPVPAAQMTYHHVGRMLLGGYQGQAGSIPATLTDGQVVNYTFNATIPSTYDSSKMKAVLLLLDATTGEVVNARSFLMGTLGTSTAETNANYVTIYPNPATEYIKIQANYNVDLKLYDASGRIALEKTNVHPDSPVSVAGLAKGTYFVTITEKGSEPKTQKLIIK